MTPNTLVFTRPKPENLPQIMAIERAGFSSEEAATEAAMAERITLINDSFITAEAGGRIVGYIVGPVVGERYIRDELFSESRPNPPQGGFQTVLSLAVHPDCQGKGIAAALVRQLINTARTARRQAITLTCLENLIPFYEKLGFKNEGVSESQHAGEVWYNLVLEV